MTSRQPVGDSDTEGQAHQGEQTYYVYDSAGQRVRKTTVSPAGDKLHETLYLGGYELYRRYATAGDVTVERQTLHVMDDKQRVALVETLTISDKVATASLPQTAIRYQFGNHLGTACLELDETGAVITYEEYYPYGGTSYQAGRTTAETSLKRYRYTGKERDKETGLYYHGARYYIPWLGRWTSCDPAGFTDGPNLYVYVCSNPISYHDPAGSQAADQIEKVVVPDKVTGKESVEEVHQIARQGGYDFTGQPKWTGKYWDVGNTMYQISPAQSGGSDHSQEPADAPGAGDATMSLAAPGAEKFIWNYPFKGAEGTFRGNILEWLYGVPWRSNTKDYDLERATQVEQVRTTSQYSKVGGITRGAMSNAADAIAANPRTMAGKQPKAVIITPTDAPSSVSTEIRTANVPGRGRKITPGAADPEHVRGLPGRIGMFGRGLTVAGFALSAWAVREDYQRGDWQMGTGDVFSAAGGGLETFALTPWGAPAGIGGVSVMTIGLALGGIGIAAASGVSTSRAAKAGDTGGVIAGVAGVAAGTLITAGAVGLAAVSLGFIAAAPLASVLLAAGLVLAAGVGIYHLWKAFRRR